MFQSLQTCRAIAAILVLLFHAAGTLAKEKYFGVFAGPLERIFWFGGEAGVAFFFVLSGFIIHHVHKADFNKPQRLMPYAQRRITRIYPPYVIIFLIVWLLAQATPSLRETVPHDAPTLFKSLLLIPQDSASAGGTGAPVLIVAWSLQYEVFFYLVFALAIFRGALFYFCVCVILIAIFLQMLIGPFAFPASFFSSHLILLFGMGMIASVLVARHPETTFPVSSWLLSAGLFLAIAVSATISRDIYSKTVFDILYGAASLLLVTSLVRFDKLRSFPATRNFNALLGDSSYCLYLLHLPLVSVLCKICIAVLPRSALGAGIAFFFSVAGCLCAAVMFHLWVERPVLKRFAKGEKAARG